MSPFATYGGPYGDTDAELTVLGILAADLVDSATIDFTVDTTALTVTGIVIDNSISNSKIRQSAGLSVLGRSANSTGNVADIVGTNNQVLRIASSVLSFGSTLDAVTIGATTPAAGTFTTLTAGKGTTSNPLIMVGKDAVGDNYISFYESTGITRQGFLGYGNTSDNTFFVTNESAGSGMALQTNGATVIFINAAGGMSLTGNLLPAVDATYTIGDATHRYTSINTNSIIDGAATGKQLSSTGTVLQIGLGSAWTEERLYVGGTQVASFTSTGMNSTAIGSTTPASGSFTTLNTSGTATLGDAASDTHIVNGKLSIIDGTVASLVVSGSGVNFGGVDVYKGVLGISALNRFKVDPADDYTKVYQLSVNTISSGLFSATQNAYIQQSGNTFFRGTLLVNGDITAASTRIYGDTTTPNIQLSNSSGALLSYGTSNFTAGGGVCRLIPGGTTTIDAQPGAIVATGTLTVTGNTNINANVQMQAAAGASTTFLGAASALQMFGGGAASPYKGFVIGDGSGYDISFGRVNAGAFTKLITFTDATDADNKLVVSGSVRGIRIGTTTTYGRIDAVDNTGGASYQPLLIGGTLIHFHIGGADSWEINANKQIIPQVSLATTMTTGFLNIPGAAGTPTGVPGTVTGFPLYWDSTNDMFYGYNGSWKRPKHDGADITTGTVATARLGSGTADSRTFLRGDQTYARSWNLIAKSADESRTSTTVLADDSELTVAVAANKTYRIIITFHATSTSGIPNIKYRIQGPAAPTFLSLQVEDQNSVGSSSFTTANVYDAADRTITIAANTSSRSRCDILLQNGANAGNVRISWAQNTSNGTPTKILKGSVVEWTQVD